MQGLYQLHRHVLQIVHCDLMSPNLVCDSHWRVKVTDFNLSRAIGSDTLSSSMIASNPRWQAPEVVARQEFGIASDAFSFGVVRALAHGALK